MANDKKKTLLEEGTVRRFMKLAELAPLANSFLDGYHTLEEQEPPEVEEMEGDLDLDLAGDEEDLDLDVDLDADLGVDLEAEAAPAEEIIMAMASKLKDVAEEYGVDVELEGDVETVELDAPEMAVDIEPDEGLGLDEPSAEELDVDVIDEDVLVNEVARRVTQRLLTNKNK